MAWSVHLKQMFEATAVHTGSCGERDLVKYEGGTGAVLWGPVRFSSLTLNCAGYDDFDVAADSGGNVYLAGGHYAFSGGSIGSFLAKIDGVSGAIVWQSPEILRLEVYSILLDSQGGAALLGRGANGYVAVARIDISTGSLLWQAEATGLAFDDPFGAAMASPAAAGSQSIFVVSGRVSGLTDLGAAAVSTVDGSLVWGPTTIAVSESSSRVVGSALQVNEAGDAVVSGTIMSSGRLEIATGKLAISYSILNSS